MQTQTLRMNKALTSIFNVKVKVALNYIVRAGFPLDLENLEK